MRLPFLSSKANGKAETLVEKRRKAAADEEEADEPPRWKKTATGKKAIAKAERKQAKKKAAWDREQERRRLDALARWETVLRSEPQAAQPAAAGRDVVAPGTALSANGRLENSRRSQAQHRRRYLDADYLDEVSDTESDESDDSAGITNSSGNKDGDLSTAEQRVPMVSGNLPAGPVFQLGSSHAAQLHQVAAMRELPMLERCATRQAPSSFFVDMLLLGDSSSAAPRTRRSRPNRRTTNEEEEEDEEEASRYRRAADKKRATRSCPTGREPYNKPTRA